MTRFFIAALYLGVSGCAALAQDVAAGETSFRKCAPCHSVGEDAANKVGPILNGLDGRKAGVVDGFNYSDANKRMVFAGIKNDKELDDLWGYLKQFAADGQKK